MKIKLTSRVYNVIWNGLHAEYMNDMILEKHKITLKEFERRRWGQYGRNTCLSMTNEFVKISDLAKAKTEKISITLNFIHSLGYERLMSFHGMGRDSMDELNCLFEEKRLPLLRKNGKQPKYQEIPLL